MSTIITIFLSFIGDGIIIKICLHNMIFSLVGITFGNLDLKSTKVGVQRLVERCRTHFFCFHYDLNFCNNMFMNV